MKTSPKLALLALLTIVTTIASAQSIGLAPAQLVSDFKPGVAFEQELSVANNGGEAVELHVQITDFWYNDKNERSSARPELRHVRRRIGSSLFRKNSQSRRANPKR
jgi:hypothetical protein